MQGAAKSGKIKRGIKNRRRVKEWRRENDNKALHLEEACVRDGQRVVATALGYDLELQSPTVVVGRPLTLGQSSSTPRKPATNAQPQLQSRALLSHAHTGDLLDELLSLVIGEASEDTPESLDVGRLGRVTVVTTAARIAPNVRVHHSW
jgi:hypothetical protein